MNGGDPEGRKDLDEGFDRRRGECPISSLGAGDWRRVGKRSEYKMAD